MTATTSTALLDRLQIDRQAVDWEHFIRTYQPFIYRWLRRRGLNGWDADDIAQDVLAVTIREIKAFRHNGSKGAFRCWLRRIVENRLRKHQRSTRRYLAQGDLIDLNDPSDELERRWDREYDAYLVNTLLNSVRSDFTGRTIRCFELTAIESVPPSDVAGRLGISKAAVIAAKARVLCRLREETRRLFPAG